jgi:cytochrome c-type biogenesis protein CcmH/NrfF
MTRPAAALLALTVLFGAGAGVAAADAGELEVSRRSQTLSRSIMSPFCPGKTIDSCPSPKAGVWREDIRRWVAEGESNAEIRSRLQARTPDFDLSGRPGAAWDWMLPAGAMALATLGLWLFVRRLRPETHRNPSDATQHAEVPSSRPRDALDDRLDAELRHADLD